MEESSKENYKNDYNFHAHRIWNMGSKKLQMREIKKIIIHCSDSEFGDAALIDKWHKERGWTGIGYHYVILNGCRKATMTGFQPYKKEDD